jgi:hypothetical protein
MTDHPSPPPAPGSDPASGPAPVPAATAAADRRRRGVGRRVFLAATFVLLAAGVGAAVVLSDPPPGSTRVTNPGTFTGTAGPGSHYRYVDRNGQAVPLAVLDIGRPSCADDEDNDLDGRTDRGDDGCADDSDANERLPGHQPYTPSTLPVRIKANGVITLRPSDLQVQPTEKCIAGDDGPQCVSITPRGAGPARRGTIEGDTITMPIPITVKLDAVTGYPGFDPACEVGYSENIYTGDYDADTGVVVLETDPAANPVPAATGCGDWTDAINGALGLPGTGAGRLVVTVLDEAGDPPRFDRD